MNNVDPNWFFSATAQSFAAIVAIIGGFILTKHISLSVNRKRYIFKINDLEDKLKNIEEKYKPAILELKKIIWDCFIRSYNVCFREIGSDFKKEFKDEFDNIEIISHYQKFEEKIKEVIKNIHRIYAVSIEIGPSDEISEIQTDFTKNKFFTNLFDKYKLDLCFENIVSSYILNEIKEGRNIVRARLKDHQEILESDEIFENKYQKLKLNKPGKDINFSEKENNLRNLWEEIQNMKDAKNQYEIENKEEIIRNKKEIESIKKSYKPIKLLFIFGVIIPLIALFLDSIFGKILCDFYYIAFFFIATLGTMSGIVFAIRKNYLYIRDYLKFE